MRNRQTPVQNKGSGPLTSTRLLILPLAKCILGAVQREAHAYKTTRRSAHAARTPSSDFDRWVAHESLRRSRNASKSTSSSLPPARSPHKPSALLRATRPLRTHSALQGDSGAEPRRIAPAPMAPTCAAGMYPATGASTSAAAHSARPKCIASSKAKCRRTLMNTVT